MSKQTIDMSDRTNNVYFDTSIYNRLLDDSNSEGILRRIKEKQFNIVPSVINLCELLMTSNIERRTALIQLYNELRNDIHPLKPDIWLLRDSVEALARGGQELEISYPLAADDETMEICSEIKKASRAGMQKSLKAAREYVQSIAKKEKLASEGQYFEYLDSDHGFDVLRETFVSLCNALGCQETLSDQATRDLIQSPALPWKYFLESIAYLYYRRAFPSERYGRDTNPGDMDLTQCIYLFWPRRFVVQDGPFHKFLKDLKMLRGYENDILEYDEFVRQLFQG